MAARRLISLLLLSAAALTAAQVPAPPKTACLARQSDPEVPEYEACSCPLLDEVSGFAPGVDYFEHKASSGNLQFWRIEYKQTYKVGPQTRQNVDPSRRISRAPALAQVITNLRDAETYVLYLCSTPVSSSTLFGAGALVISY